jgi:hypothetical protein
MEKHEQKIKESIDGLADDIIDFASRLVSEPSTLEHEASVMALMEAELNKLSFEPFRIPIDPESLSKHPGFAPVPLVLRRPLQRGRQTGIQCPGGEERYFQRPPGCCQRGTIGPLG